MRASVVALSIVFGLTALADTAARADDAPAAVASETSTSIVVVGAADDSFAIRLVAELESLGFHAVIVPPTENPSRASLEAAARDHQAIAAIRGVASERGVEIWIADRVTGKTVLRVMVRADGGREPDDALALRTVELLRASLLEMSLAPPPRGEVRATPEIRERLAVPRLAVAVESAPMLRLSLAPSILVSPGGFGPATSLALGLSFMPSKHIGVIALAAVPLVRPTTTARAGTITLSPLLAGGGMRFAMNDRAARWTPNADIGLVVVALDAIGAPSTASGSKSASGADVAPYVSLGVGLAVSKNFRLRADVLGATLVDSATIKRGSDSPAHWGAPLVMPSIGADCGWF